MSHPALPLSQHMLDLSRYYSEIHLRRLNYDVILLIAVLFVGLNIHTVLLLLITVTVTSTC